MESSKQHFEQQQPAVAGAFSNLKHLRKNTSASAAELREFLGQLKGRSPQQVMGVVAHSSLVQGVTTATIASGVLLLVFTIVPYALSGGPAAAEPKKTTPVAAAVAETTAATAVVEPAATAGKSSQKSKEPDLKRAADAMGIGDSALADAKTLPLDSKLDQLLDGIK